MPSACCRIRTRRGKVDLAARHYDQIDAAIFDAALRSVVVCHRVELRTAAVEMRSGGGRPAQALSQFYAYIFAQLLQASQLGSKAKFDHAIECVRTVRNAWREVLNDPDANPGSARVIELPVRNTSRSAEDESTVVRWTASTASPGYGELFFQLLFLIEAGVVAIAGQQFIVPA